MVFCPGYYRRRERVRPRLQTRAKTMRAGDSQTYINMHYTSRRHRPHQYVKYRTISCYAEKVIWTYLTCIIKLQKSIIRVLAGLSILSSYEFKVLQLKVSKNIAAMSKRLIFNSVINFRRVTHFQLCLFEI